MKLVSVAEMQAIEREADAAGLSYAQMMENAGAGLAEEIARSYGHFKTGGALGLVGSGNNGGDTLVALEWLARQGWPVRAYLVRPRPDSDPLVARLQQAGGWIDSAERDPDFTRLSDSLQNSAVLLDGVLGTGFRLPLKPEVAQVLGSVRQMLMNMENPPQVVAVDCPSGVDCDTGEAAAETIPAAMTVTMAATKRGLLRMPAFELSGEIRLTGIGLPEGGSALKAWSALEHEVADAGLVRQMLPPRPVLAHKGTFGTALVVAGSVNYTGAALLAGEAAYRSGAGLVTLAVPAPLHVALAASLPEATWVLLPHELGVISAGAVDVLQKNLGRATAVLIGPGFGAEDATAEFVARLFTHNSRSGRSGIGFVRSKPADEPKESTQLPGLVIDADGLNLGPLAADLARRTTAVAERQFDRSGGLARLHDRPEDASD
jgi:NAD(P)H-hydrate epimerase